MKFSDQILKVKNRMPGFIAAKRAALKGEQLGIITARANKSAHSSLITRLEKSLNTKINPDNIHFVSDSGYDGSDAAEKKLNVIKKYSKLYEKVKFYDDEIKNISIVKNSGLPNVKAYNIKEFDPKKLNELKASNNNTIHLFDLDGTVWKLPAFIRIIKNGKEIKKISQEQFAHGYKLKSGESFDFSDFSDEKKLKQAAKSRGIFHEAI